MNSSADKQHNIKTAQQLCATACQSGAAFILLPEVFNLRADSKTMQQHAEPIPGPSLSPLMQLAKEHQAWILAGSLCEKIKNQTKVYNSSALIGPSGTITAIYRKIHLFDAAVDGKNIRESTTFAPGSQQVVTTINTIHTGLAICYDLRFPDLFKSYREQNTKMICLPSAFTATTGKADWERLLRTRAKETNTTILAPNQTGIGSQGVRCYGNSMIVAPDGQIIARASQEKEEILTATLVL